MATQSGPKGDWHQTWQAIRHQSHVAISPYTASFSNVCVCLENLEKDYHVSGSYYSQSDEGNIQCLCELKCVNEEQAGRATRGKPRNQGTIKLLVQAEGVKPRSVCQNFDCCAFTTDSEVVCIESEKRFPVWSIHDRWHMIQLSYHKCGGGG